MATRYHVTDKKYTASGKNADHVYKIVEASGDAGCVWADIAAQMPSGVAQSGVYSYLYTLRKDGYIESREIATTTVREEDAAQLMQVRDTKWKCPTCKKWITEPLARKCKSCRENSHGENRSQP